MLPQVSHAWVVGRSRPPMASRHWPGNERHSRSRSPRAGSSVASTTRAPPPSATMKLASDLISSSIVAACPLRTIDARSPVVTSTRRALPERIRESATSRPSMRPLQAFITSKTRALTAPTASATTFAVAGSKKSFVMPVKSTTSTDAASTSASSSAFRPARTANAS